MGKQTPISTQFNLPDGREVVIETGKLAAQADGSVVIRCGNTMIFASVVSATEMREGQGFFPLSVDYQEKFAAAGRVPGNFFRRETKLNDYEVLTSRLVDRALRPLFPDGYMYETQVLINLISGEENTPPDAFVALAASAALSVSDIPFGGPISEVRVARINGEFIVNPEKSSLADADLDIIVAATMDNVMMVEGEGQEVSESVLIEAIRVGHEAIKVQCQAQLDLAQKVGETATIKREFEAEEVDQELYNAISDFAKQRIIEMTEGHLDKKARKEQSSELKDALEAHFEEKMSEEEYAEKKGLIKEYFYTLRKKTVRDVVLSSRVRMDGRQPNEIRHIWTEVDYLPAAHGSAIFTRGETQALTSLTLGTKSDEMMVDNAMGMYFEKFILHYNFPPYSVGEVRRSRPPGRREVGHANLAARSLKPVLPEENPYTMRIVSDILESNGSSSMATVCAGTLALMDAGIKIKAPVSGIAMGMISDGERHIILSDILGDEDALGDMDFKITGTRNGITACQMDIKIDGLPYELLEQALNQARDGRMHILDKMAETLEAPREDLKPHAPRIVEMVIDKSFIGAVIGPGGSIIQELQEVTNTVINIDEVDGKGIVSISSNNKASIDAAVSRIKSITFSPEVGDVFKGKVASIQDYGAFVDFGGSKSGLLHVSEIAYERVNDVRDYLKEGQEIEVKLVAVDKKTGKMRLSRKALLPRPEGGQQDDRGDRRRDDRNR